MRSLNKRWWLLIRDCNGTVIFNQACWTRRGARREGRLTVTPPLNTFEVVKLGKPMRVVL